MTSWLLRISGCFKKVVAKTGLTVVTFNDKDPPWMSEYLKNKTK